MNVDYKLDEIHKVAKKVTQEINSNIILISGEVGAGKTTLIKEILKILKVNENVNSPTFSIINEYLSEDKKTIKEYNSELEACRAKSKTFSMDQE